MTVITAIPKTYGILIPGKSVKKTIRLWNVLVGAWLDLLGTVD